MLLLEKNVIKAVLGGLKTYFPSLNDYRGTGGSDHADYCYSVWYRHRFYLEKAGYSVDQFKTMIELGPGDSLGVSMCAHLDGISKVIALDVVDHPDPDLNFQVATDLLSLRSGVEISKYPMLRPTLPEGQSVPFPQWDPQRADSLRAWSQQMQKSRKAMAPIEMVIEDWTKKRVELEPVDLIVAQGVLQYLDFEKDLPVFHQWLKPGGILSAQSDLSSLGITKDWNGHWALPDFVWSLMIGRRPFFSSRRTYSELRKAFSDLGFELVFEKPELRGSTYPKDSFLIQRSRYKNVPDDDFRASQVHMILRKKS